MMALLIRSLVRQPNLLKQIALMTPKRSTATKIAYDEMSQYWKTNKSLKRPLSPFLTVYKPHLAMMTSLTHRVTGVCMQVVICGTSIILLCVPGDFEHNLKLLKNLSLSQAIIIPIKYILSLTVVYHFLNGIRHLAWDAGVGFGLPTLYKSAYFVMALTFVVSTFFVFCLPMQRPSQLKQK